MGIEWWSIPVTVAGFGVAVILDFGIVCGLLWLTDK
jgi:hypothetical protein